MRSSCYSPGRGNRIYYDYQPVLKGTLVELRPLRADDFDDLYAAAADPLIWEQHPVSNRHEAAAFRQYFDDAIASGGALTVIDIETGKVIGSSRFHDFDEARDEVEIGWTFLSRSHWGGDYNGEMKQLMLRHAFRYVGHVVLLVGRDNVRSQRAVEKIGGIRAGARPDAGGNDSFVYRVSAVQGAGKVVES